MPHNHDHPAHDHDDDHGHEGHGHEHGHGHSHAPTTFGKAFAMGVSLNLAYVVVQAVFGILGNSLALLADAAHNLSDVLALVLAWAAGALATRVPNGRFTYGLRKTSILAALANAGFLLLVTGGIAWEAVQRFLHPSAAQGSTIVWVAAVGMVLNGATALLFFSGRKSDLNVRGAFLHMASDAVVSLGVVIAGVGILYTGWMWLDPAVSLAVSVVIVVGTWGLLRDSVRLSLDAVPGGIDITDVRRYLAGLDGVASLHDLHVWAMSTTETALTVHLLMPGGHPGDAFVGGICRQLQARFRIGHATVQVETDPHHACPLAPEHVV